MNVSLNWLDLNEKAFPLSLASISVSKSSLSNNDIVKIDKKLKSYSENNIELNVVEGIDLTTQKGTYTSLE